jgi:hypothetical protein
MTAILALKTEILVRDGFMSDDQPGSSWVERSDLPFPPEKKPYATPACHAPDCNFRTKAPR